MRKLILLIFLLVSASGLSDKGEILSQFQFDSSISDVHSEVIDLFVCDLSEQLSADARSRTFSSSSNRFKNDRFIGYEYLPGLIFYTCRIAKSYSEVNIDKYIKHLFQYTVQVNAP